MLIKGVNGRVTYDEIQTSEMIMNDQISGWEVKEEDMILKTVVVNENINVTRTEINTLKQRRAAKEGVLERFDAKIKEVEARIKEVEARNQLYRNDTRLDQMAKEKEKKIKSEIKRLLENQVRKSAQILEGLLDTDRFQRQMHVVVDRQMRIHERMRALKDELMFLITRQDEVELSVRKEVESIKQTHARIIQVGPLIKDSIKRGQELSKKFAELKEKVKNGEEEVRRVQTERIRMIGEMERRSVECGQKQKKSIQGPAMIEALKEYTRPKKPIECYKVKNPDVIKAFEKFTELYGNYNKTIAY